MKKKTMVQAAARGFSLLELMLVLAIIGVLMAVAAANFAGSGERAKIRTTKISLGQIRAAIRAYHMDNNAYPPSLAALTTGRTAYLSTDYRLADGWGQEFVYGFPGSNGMEFDLFSKGGDGTFGTADDISVWTMEQPAGTQ